MIVAANASNLTLTLGVGLGIVGALVAVSLAQNIPTRMDREPRRRSAWWWGVAIALGGAYGGLTAAAIAPWPVLLAFLTFGGATLALGLIDLDHQLIPNRVLFPSLGVAGLLLTIGALTDGAGGALLRGLAGAAAYFLGLLLFALLARGGFGMGDVKLALLLGLFLAYLGWGELALGSILAVLLGGIASALLLVTGIMKRDSKFAYGPYLIVGSWVAIIWGEHILDWYLR